MTDFPKPTALITGGTRGIGLAIARAYGRLGYDVTVTHNWGSVDEKEITNLFTSEDLPPPLIYQADVSNDEDTTNLLEEIKKRAGTVDVFISNVSFCSLVKSIDDYNEKDLLRSLEYSSWPLVNYPRHIKKILGAYPRYVIGLSSDGVDSAAPNYDFVAASKYVMEILVKYLNHHFYNEGVIFNIIRTRPMVTESLLATCGKEVVSFLDKYDDGGLALSPDEFAKTVVMMTSGLMDGIRGQTINADRGFSFAAGIFGLYNEVLDKGL